MIFEHNFKIAMAAINKLNINYFLTWEGGLSDNPNDSASGYPSPYLSVKGRKYHSNKGVTYKTFIDASKSMKFTPTEYLFLKMPNWLWKKIFQKKYWNLVKASKIRSQVIGEFVTDWAWMSGPSSAIKGLQKAMNSLGEVLIVDGLIGPKTLSALNSQIKKKGTNSIFEAIYNQRVDFFKSLRDYTTFGKGWMNRMVAFRKMYKL